MSTSAHDVKPDPAALDRHRWSRGKTIGALAVALALVALIAALLIVQSRDEAPVTAQVPENAVNASGVDVATGFLAAFGAFDVERAMTYLTDDATIASLGGRDDLRLLMSWLEATGYQQILDHCGGAGSSASGNVRCAFDFHGLRSGELGRGPFGGSFFDLVVRDGKVVDVSQTWVTDKFSPQVWEPFSTWVSTAHPKDAAVMYTDESHSNVMLTPRSIRLWELRTQEYVEEMAG